LQKASYQLFYLIALKTGGLSPLDMYRFGTLRNDCKKLHINFFI